MLFTQKVRTTGLACDRACACVGDASDRGAGLGRLRLATRQRPVPVSPGGHGICAPGSERVSIWTLLRLTAVSLSHPQYTLLHRLPFFSPTGLSKVSKSGREPAKEDGGGVGGMHTSVVFVKATRCF
jgi:hypothetical protein